MEGLSWRGLAVGGLVLWSAAGCDVPPANEPVPTREMAEVPLETRPEQQAPAEDCALASPGATPTEALEAMKPSYSAGCGMFPAACRPEGFRRAFPQASNACHVYAPSDEELPSYSVTYDANGRVISHVGPHRRLREDSRYDGCGRLLSRSINGGGMITYEYGWEYGPGGRVVGYTVAHGFSRSTTRYTYDTSGRLTQAETTSHVMTGAGVLSSRAWYSHDDQGRVVQARYETGPGNAPEGRVTQLEARAYSPSGELASLHGSSPTGDSSSLRFFSKGWLIREQVVTGSTHRERTWDYGPDGSLLKERTRTISEGGTSTSEVRYAYDQKGRLTDYTRSNDIQKPDGSVTSSEHLEGLTYGIEGRLRLLTYTDGATGQPVRWYYEGSCY